MTARTHAIAAACAVLAAAQVIGQQPARPPEAARRPPSASRSARIERAVPFKVGESLTYDVGWSSYLTAGSATVTVTDKKDAWGSRVYTLVAEGRPTSWLAALYPVYYKVQTDLDAFTLLPRQSILYSQEGHRRRTRTTRYDEDAHTADLEITTATVVKRQLRIPRNSLDTLGAVFVMRALPLKQGFRTTLAVADGDDFYDVRVAVAGREHVDTPLGSMAAWRIAPTVTTGTSDMKGRAFVIWITDDSRRWPVRMEAEMPVGRFTLSLREGH